MRGRKPKPTILKLLQGNPGRRPLNQNEPQPPAGSVKPPLILRGHARAIWKNIAPELLRLGLLTTLDTHHLARICRLEGLALKLLRQAEKRPMALTKSNGIQPAGELTGALRLFEATDRWWARFGVSPAERTRIRVSVEQEDEFDRFDVGRQR
jgi:P27 family predicted phage terminase small subunit